MTAFEVGIEKKCMAKLVFKTAMFSVAALLPKLSPPVLPVFTMLILVLTGLGLTPGGHRAPARPRPKTDLDKPIPRFGLYPLAIRAIAKAFIAAITCRALWHRLESQGLA